MTAKQKNDRSTNRSRSTRYYAISDKKSGEIIGLVEAISAASARSHHARKTVDVRYAEQKDLLVAAKGGIEPEEAGAEVEEAEGVAAQDE